jgi:hypothetical protein
VVTVLKKLTHHSMGPSGFPKHNRDLDITLIQKDCLKPVLRDLSSAELLVKVNEALLEHNISDGSTDIKV